MSDNLREVWSKLSKKKTDRSGIVILRVNSGHLVIYAGWQKPENLPALVIEVPTSNLPTDVIYPQSSGFKLTPEPVKKGKFGITRLQLIVRNVHYRDVFEALAVDVYNNILKASDATELVKMLVERLVRWQTFVKKHKSARLTEAQQTGLWGELSLLHTCIMPELGSEESISAWKGPDGSNQDFEFSGKAIEVKATSANPHEKIRISNILQLETTGLDHLYICHISVAVHRESGTSLPELIERIREELKNTSSALSKFNDKLFKVGYLDEESDYYGKKGFTSLKETFYEVKGDFPRMQRGSLQEGIGDVKYSIVLSACREYALNRSIVFSGS